MTESKKSEPAQALAADTICKKCGSIKVKVDFGLNYHFHCLACKSKTNIRKLKCTACEGVAKLKKRGQDFYAVCKSCQHEDLYFSNKPQRGRLSKQAKEVVKTKTQARKDKKAIALGEVENPCPKCGHSMFERTIQKGENEGKKYMGCSAYPKCKHKEPCV